MIAESIERSFISPNVSDSNMEPANIVDVVNMLCHRVNAVAKAITPTNAVGNNDATGGHVESLTEAVMGLTAGMCRIADEINGLADAVRHHGRV